MWSGDPTLPLGPLGFEGAQHRQTLRPSVVGIRSKALPFKPLGPLGFNSPNIAQRHALP